MLVDMKNGFAVYLTQQSFDDELKHLEVKYGSPDGRLYLAAVDGKAAGCVALRRMNEQRCELKRLYVRPPFRGHGLARMMASRIIGDAREIGYSSILLDTQPELFEALALYESLGFYVTERYNDSLLPDTIYMRLDL